MMTAAVRCPFLFLFKITGRFDLLLLRANYTEIGLSGYVSAFDKDVIEERNLKPLNRFERWLLRPIVEDEKELRRDVFKQAFIEVTGEDPTDPNDID